jgi:hypothetical protein
MTLLGLILIAHILCLLRTYQREMNFRRRGL